MTSQVERSITNVSCTIRSAMWSMCIKIDYFYFIISNQLSKILSLLLLWQFWPARETLDCRRQSIENETQKKRRLSLKRSLQLFLLIDSNSVCLFFSGMADLSGSCDVPAVLRARLKRPHHAWETRLPHYQPTIGCMLTIKKIAQSLCTATLIWMIRLWNTVSAASFKCELGI